MSPANFDQCSEMLKVAEDTIGPAFVFGVIFGAIACLAGMFVFERWNR